MLRYIVLTLYFLLFTLIVVGTVHAIATESRHVNITVHNTSRFHVEAEVKCDWSGKDWSHYQKVEIPGKKNKTLQVPKDVKNCEVWPRVNLWR